jgi:hypothetical protein
MYVYMMRLCARAFIKKITVDEIFYPIFNDPSTGIIIQDFSRR